MRILDPDLLAITGEEQRAEIGTRPDAESVEVITIVGYLHQHRVLAAVSHITVDLGSQCSQHTGIHDREFPERQRLVGIITRSAREHTTRCLHLRSLCTTAHIVTQFDSHRHLILRGLAQRDTDRIADALMEQRTDAYCTLDATILGIARLCHSEMQREVHSLPIHLRHKKPHRLHHHHRVRSLDRNHDIAEIHLTGYAQILHHRLHHTRRSVAISAHDAIGERTMVHTETHRCVVLTTQIEEGQEILPYAVDLPGILLVGKLQLAERAGGIDEIAGVDTHLVGSLGSLISRLGIEMHICRDRHLTPYSLHLLADSHKIKGLLDTLSGESHQLPSGIGYPLGLCRRTDTI